MGMNKQVIPALAKSGSSSSSSAESKKKAANVRTMAALREASDIMNGKKKVEWNQFQPNSTKEEAKETVKNIIES
jgi:Mg-chelatase subunit ChlD